MASEENVVKAKKKKLEELVAQLNAAGLSFDEKRAVIDELRVAVDELKAAEDEEHEQNERAKEEREREQREAAERKERERKEEHAKEVTCMDLPVDWVNVFDGDDRTIGVHADSSADGLILSLSNLGRVDIEYIASITDKDYKTVIADLKGAIFQDPETWDECFYKGWEVADEYLSGNLMRKLRAAKEANDTYCGYFADNVAAIEETLPSSAADDIYVSLGSPWLPADVVDEFVLHLFGEPPQYKSASEETKEEMRQSWRTVHDETIGTWEIPFKNRYRDSVAVTKTYGTTRMQGMYILERTLNMKNIVVTDEISCPSSPTGTKRAVNKAETVAALEMQRKIVDEFKRWVLSDAERKARLVEIFENRYGCLKRRKFDGSFLTFPGMSPSVNLYSYQKDAVARIIFTPNVLLAHDVGAGKTYVMIAAGQEVEVHPIQDITGVSYRDGLLRFEETGGALSLNVAPETGTVLGDVCSASLDACRREQKTAQSAEG